MYQIRLLACCVATLFSVAGLAAADSDLADAVMAGDRAAVRRLLQQAADVNAAQVDGTTALHWAIRRDDLEIAHLLIGAGADVSAANLAGATPMRLATINGNAAMIESLLEAGVDSNAALSQHGDTALMMAARTGRIDALQVLLDHGADIDARETWGGTTAVMWAVSEHHATAVRMLIDHGADVDARSRIYPLVGRGGSEGPEPEDAAPESAPVGYSNGGFTALLFAAREGDLESARLLVAADANVNATASDGKDSLGLAIYNGNYELASFLLDSGSQSTTPTRRGSRRCSGRWIAATWNGTPGSRGR